MQEAMEQRMARDLFFGVNMEEESEMAMREYNLRIEAICECFGLAEESE